MGQCLGKPKKNVKSKSIAQPKIYQSREADDTLEDKRRKAAEAAEKRQQKVNWISKKKKKFKIYNWNIKIEYILWCLE